MTTEALRSSSPEPKKSLKRSLFKRPAWVKPCDGDEDDIFHRSSRMYHGPDSKHLRRNEQPESNSNVRARGHKPNGFDESDHSHHGLANDISRSPKTSSEVDVEGPRLEPVDPASSLRRQDRATLSEAKLFPRGEPSSEVPTVIDLNDQARVEETKSPDVAISRPIDRYDVLSEDAERLSDADEEFPELARKAREKARRKRLEQDLGQTKSSLDLSPNDHSEDKGSTILHAQPSHPIIDPSIQILVTSNIENTRPLIVSRRFSQRLRDVRLAWVNYQSSSNPMVDQILLTWRGKRIFDVTSCKSLGLKVNAEGRIASLEDPTGDERQIHMVAMTVEQYNLRRKAKDDPELEQIDRNDLSQETQEKPPQPDPEIRIILKAKNLNDFKLKVRPVSHCEKAIRYRPATDED